MVALICVNAASCGGLQGFIQPEKLGRGGAVPKSKAQACLGVAPELWAARSCVFASTENVAR
jgi:hypothetical protein